MKMQMVDLKTQYEKIKEEVNAGIQEVLDTSAFIQGPAVKRFQENLERYLDVKHVIPCANGTDALQIAMMALDLQPGDEVITASFTYVATAEVLALLGLKPVLVEVYLDDFTLNVEAVEAAIGPKTKAIVPVHLFGQGARMPQLMEVARKHKLFVIEDTAQAIGAKYKMNDNGWKALGTIGDIGCTSFFPSKNLGCYGDGGALYTNNDELAGRIRMIANHGQKVKYHHEVIGVNSRLDTLQAAILDVKLKHLDEYAEARNKAANYYDKHLAGIPGLTTPVRNANSTHVFHQYTLKIANGKRDALKDFLGKWEIPTMVYYPLPLHHQNAFKNEAYPIGSMPITEKLVEEVLSLPMHTELSESELELVVGKIREFFSQN